LKPLEKGYASIPCYVLFGALGLGVFSHPVGILCGVTILCFLKVEDLVPSAFRFKPLLIMGDSSYSIYLIQILTISASTKLAKWVVLATPLVANNYLFFYFLSIAIAIASTTAAGILMRRYLEKPSYRYLVNLRNKAKISL
jgi:peptidoglycan/LPS O-acetylase OafA/YrhL